MITSKYKLYIWIKLMMEKKSNQLKLPIIKRNSKEVTNGLLKTVTDNSCTPKMRPASGNKVEDLQKKLFGKLQAYENVSKKSLIKKGDKAIKQMGLESNNNNELPSQNYQKIQKLMPSLYSKLLQTKKGTMLTALNSQIKQRMRSSTQIKIQSSQQPKPNPTEQDLTFVTSNKQSSVVMSEEQMQKMFTQYQLQQGFAHQTTNQEIHDLGNSINMCQKQIEQLKKSMEGLIYSIGMEYINQAEGSQEYNIQE